MQLPRLGAFGEVRVDVLVVCTANIARSPLFAAMLGARFGDPEIVVTSAGVAARDGDLAAAHARTLAAARGLDLSDHRSRPVTPEAIAAADLVLTMSERQRDRCAPLAAGTAGRVFTVREFVRLLDEVDHAAGPAAPAERLAWLRDEAHRARPRALPAEGREDVDDPIREPWPAWVAMGATFDELIGAIAARR